MKNIINYKSILVIWIAVGVGVSGYFYIYPVKHKVYRSGSIYERREEIFGAEYESGKESEVSLLITIVGSILIYGLGRTIFAIKNKN